MKINMIASTLLASLAVLTGVSGAAFVPKVRTSTQRLGKTAVDMSGIKVALQSDTGNYLGRCNGCIPGGAYPDSAFVHVKESELAGSPWAHWTIENLDGNKYILQADTSNCLARCNGCVPGGAYPDNAMVHVPYKDAKGAGYAQWIIETLSPGKYALKSSDSGNYLGRCNNCIPDASNSDSAFVHVKPSELKGASWAHWNMFFLP